MPDWLSLSDFNPQARFALYTLAGVFVTTLVLFVYTMSLRISTMRGDSRRRELRAVWRRLFASAVMSRDAAESIALPEISRRDRIPLLEVWNRTQLAVDGDAAENLNILAARAGIDAAAGILFHSHDLREKVLAVQTLGHLRDVDYREAILGLIDSSNTVLSITAVLALVEIDPDLAVHRIVPLIARRRDWPKAQVSLCLRMAGGERISEPMYRALRSADDDARIYLLQFAGLVEAEVLDALVVELIRESRNPGIINAALKLVTGFTSVPRLAQLTRHPAWFVRMQAANVLGRLGDREHVSLIESLLGDSEWWVRYRAAQSLVSLPCLGPNKLREIRDRQTDRYAADILEQAFAEVGIV